MILSRLKLLATLSVAALASVVLAACPIGESGAQCIPGETRQCVCPDGTTKGRQICLDDGKSLGQCECADPPAKAESPTKTPAVVQPPIAPISPATLPPAPAPGSPMVAMASPFQADNATIGLWHFDEGSGTTTADVGPYKLASTVNDTTWTAGRFGGALMFGGTSSNIKIASNESFFPATSITIEAWVRPETAGFMTVYDIQDTQGLSVRPRGNGVEVVFTLRINEVVRTLVSTEPVPLRQWHHVAGTFDGAAMRLWIDGMLKGELSTPGTLTRAMQCEDPAIGSNCSGSGEWFNGGIDEVRISNIARYTSSEATVTAQAGDAGAADASQPQEDAGRRTKRGKKTSKRLSDVAGDTARKALKTLGL